MDEFIDALYAAADREGLAMPGPRVIEQIFNTAPEDLTPAQRQSKRDIEALMERQEPPSFFDKYINPFSDAGTFEVGPVKVKGSWAALGAGLVSAGIIPAALAPGAATVATGTALKSGAQALGNTVQQAGQKLAPALPGIAKSAGTGAAIGLGAETVSSVAQGEGLPSLGEAAAAAGSGAIAGGGTRAAGGGRLSQGAASIIAGLTGGEAAGQATGQGVPQTIDLFGGNADAATAFNALTPEERLQFGQMVGQYQAGTGQVITPEERVALLTDFAKTLLGSGGDTGTGTGNAPAGQDGGPGTIGGLSDFISPEARANRVAAAEPILHPVTAPDGSFLGYTLTDSSGNTQFIGAGTSEESARQYQSQRDLAQRDFEQQLLTQRQEFERQLAEANAQAQAQIASIPLFQQLLDIQSSPSQRLRFTARRAEAAGQETIPYEINDLLSSFFGLQSGADLPIGGDETLFQVPNLGQLSGLTSGEVDELDALAEILFGQSYEGIAKKSRELAPPGGSRLFVQ